MIEILFYILTGFIAGIIFTIVVCYMISKRMQKKLKTETAIQKETEEFVNIFLDYSKVRNN